MIEAKKVALIHALEESKQPVWKSFYNIWPEAVLSNYSDLSLSKDRNLGQNENTISQRISNLAKMAVSENADAILYTCSAFGDEINRVKDQYSIPILRPNEAAFIDAIQLKQKIKIMVTFLPSLELLTQEIKTMMVESNTELEVKGIYVKEALNSLQNGLVNQHDDLIAKIALDQTDDCTIILGQFSMASALSNISEKNSDLRVLTTPDSSVLRLKKIIEAKFKLV